MAKAPDASTQERSLGVDFLRAVCILYIVGFWHLASYTTAMPGYANWLTEGLKYVALSTFVFCSGYLLARHRVTLDVGGLWHFYRRRLLRIYPLYFATLVLFFFAGLVPAQTLASGICLLSMFDPPAAMTLWFVTMIMSFYLVAPVLIRCADRAGLLLFVCALLALGLVAQHLLVKPIDLRILVYLPVFALGILFQRGAGMRARLARRRVQLALLAILLLPLSRIGNEQSLMGIATLMPLVLASGPVVMSFADDLAQRVRVPLIGVLAYASFSLYLVHRLVFHLLIGLYFPANGWDQFFYLLLVAMPLSLLTGYWVQRGYDGLAARLHSGQAA